MLDDMNSRENAIFQMSSCCEQSCDRSALVYYIETLEEIIRQLSSEDPLLTNNQRDILEVVKKV